MSTADWEVTYSILPRLEHSEKVGDYDFRAEPDSCTVSVKFSNQLQPDCNGKLNVDHIGARMETDFHRAHIEELMLIRNVYQQVTSPITVSVVRGPVLLNDADLRREGIIPVWPVVKTLAIAYRILQVGDSLGESQGYWQKACLGKMSAYRSDVLRIEKWLQSSEGDDAYGASFVHLWTAFNAMWSRVCDVIPCGKSCDHCSELRAMQYGVRHLLRGSSNGVKRAVARDTPIISQEEWVHASKKAEHFGKELRVALGSSEGDALETIVAALKCAYVFRCQLFHEAREPAYVAHWSPVFSHLLRQVTTTCLFNLTQL